MGIGKSFQNRSKGIGALLRTIDYLHRLCETVPSFVIEVLDPGTVLQRLPLRQQVLARAKFFSPTFFGGIVPFSIKPIDDGGQSRTEQYNGGWFRKWRWQLRHHIQCSETLG